MKKQLLYSAPRLFHPTFFAQQKIALTSFHPHDDQPGMQWFCGNIPIQTPENGSFGTQGTTTKNAFVTTPILCCSRLAFSLLYERTSRVYLWARDIKQPSWIQFLIPSSFGSGYQPFLKFGELFRFSDCWCWKRAEIANGPFDDGRGFFQKTSAKHFHLTR